MLPRRYFLYHTQMSTEGENLNDCIDKVWDKMNVPETPIDLSSIDNGQAHERTVCTICHLALPPNCHHDRPGYQSLAGTQVGTIFILVPRR